ncbi:hypothetical protein PC9H_011461 [Pleurotus ostreatus]|uniref:Ribonuclease H1 N-terminal domain-containing protein n=1 Tax=Pleurotus ostreatus TaxID=5322 RepID=A0A8H7DQK1_PLEOS|nr:uncharacterized protein PC9H_011461 [Pleurotus ostreatus]KAF7420942.1 hypothetical protein PC9H_011461 [Pleurotus ostreatus]
MTQSKPVGDEHTSGDDMAAQLSGLSLSPDQARTLAGALTLLANSAPSAPSPGSGTSPMQGGPPATSVAAPGLSASAARRLTASAHPVHMPPTVAQPVSPPAIAVTHASVTQSTAPAAVAHAVVACAAIAQSIGPPAAAPTPVAHPAVPPAIVDTPYTPTPASPRYHLPQPGSPGPYYVITRGRQVGIFTNWTATAPLVIRVPGAVFESVRSLALAREMMEEALDDGIVSVIDIEYTRRPRMHRRR